MKFFTLASLFCFVMVTYVTMSNATSTYGLNKRTGSYQSIADSFATIAKTIQGLSQAQQAAGQANPPDFTKASKGLAELSMEAEAAELKLRAIGVAKLDASTAQSIGVSVTQSSQYVQAITAMVKYGKEYFEKNHVTGTVVTILKANIAQFRSLFYELDRHVDYATVRAYARPQIVFLCSMVNAVVILDPNAISAGARQFCSNPNSDHFDPAIFGGWTNTPQGYGSCGNSPTTFYQQAYTSGTMGTPSTTCSSGTQAPKSYAIPANCLMPQK